MTDTAAAVDMAAGVTDTVAADAAVADTIVDAAGAGAGADTDDDVTDDAVSVN